MVILKCEKCGLSVSGESLLEAITELSKMGCVITLGYKAWCACGGVNTFKRKDR